VRDWRTFEQLLRDHPELRALHEAIEFSLPISMRANAQLAALYFGHFHQEAGE